MLFHREGEGGRARGEIGVVQGRLTGEGGEGEGGGRVGNSRLVLAAIIRILC